MFALSVSWYACLNELSRHLGRNTACVLAPSPYFCFVSHQLSKGSSFYGLPVPRALLWASASFTSALLPGSLLCCAAGVAVTVCPGGLLDEPAVLLCVYSDLCSGLGGKVPSPVLVFNATGSVFQVKLVRLVGIMLLLYVKADLALNISEVEIETVGTGIMGRMVRIDNRLWRTLAAHLLGCRGFSPS